MGLVHMSGICPSAADLNAKNIEGISMDNVVCEGFHGLVTIYQGKCQSGLHKESIFL